MGVISDFFTDPPELVAQMRVKPSEPLRLSLAQAEQVGPAAFVEQVETDHADRQGMAAPHRRPRRVAKKLAARGYAVHFGGQAFTAAQVRSTKHSAPALAYWLGRPGLPTSALTIELGAVHVLETGLAPLGPGLAEGPSIQIYSFPPPTLGPIATGPTQHLQRITLGAKEYGIECAVYRRLVRCLIRVFREDKDDVAAHAAVRTVVERIAERVVRSIAKAAHGWTDTKVVSRQTSYRPIARS